MCAEDVANRVLDLLTFLDILSVLAVCRRWRELALRHPSYWADITLRGTTAGALELFKLQLARSGARRIRLTIEISGLPDVVLAALATHLFHVGTLAVRLAANNLSTVLNALRLPAPLLTRLSLFAVIAAATQTFDETTTIYPMLPVDLFCGIAPLLRYTSVTNITLPPVVPSALTVVTTFITGFQSAQEVLLPNLFEYCPQLRTLGIGGASSLHDPAYHDRSNWHSVSCLMLNTFFECNEYILTCLPIDKIPLIHVACCERDQPDLLIQHLNGPLSLIFADRSQDDPGLFLINVTAQTTGMTRTFPELWPDWTDHHPHNLFQRMDISQRIVSLTIPDTIWLKVTSLQLSLPTVVELRLHLYKNEFTPSLVEHSLMTPKLRTLVLRSDIDSAFVTTTHLVDFARSSLCHVGYPISLKLENVFIDDRELSQLHKFFNTVSHQSLDVWRYPAPAIFAEKG